MPLNNETTTKCFLSMQFGKVGRSMKNPFWMQPYFEFTIVCPNAILETTVGDRILAIEQCLTDTFEFQNVGNVGMLGFLVQLMKIVIQAIWQG